MPVLPKLAIIFVATLLALTPVSILAGRRGGRYRALPGWIAAWGWFAVLIIVLSRLSRAVSFPLLGVVMFGALKQYFTLTQLRKGSLELFGIVGVLADFPQRLAGRMRPGGESFGPALGVVAGVALAAG